MSPKRRMAGRFIARRRRYVPRFRPPKPSRGSLGKPTGEPIADSPVSRTVLGDDAAMLTGR